MTEAGELDLEVSSHTDEAARSVVWQGLTAYNSELLGMTDGRLPLSVVLRRQGEVVGGLLGDTYYGWLAINLLWLSGELRGQGHGAALLREAEGEALRRGCSHAHVDTFSFQAPDFYQRHGYHVIGALTDLPPGHRRIYLRKDLAGTESPPK